MYVVRLAIFALFLAIAACLAAWEAWTVYGFFGLDEPARNIFRIGLGTAMLALCGVELWLLNKHGRTCDRVLGLVLLPIRVIYAGFGRMVMGKGAGGDRLSAALRGIAIAGVNIAAPVLLALAIEGPRGLMTGFAAVTLQFFAVVNWNMGRALVNYFGGAASAFLSVRYLRKRLIALFSIAGVAAGIGILIVVNSIMQGFVRNYRELVRGSLSHVLVYTHPSAFSPSSTEVDREVWRHYYTRVQADPALRAQWRHALALSVREILTGEPAQYVNASATAFPSALEPEIPAGEPGTHARRLLESLDAPDAGAQYTFDPPLPKHPQLGIATPENIWLSRHPSAKAREEERSDTRAEISALLQVPRLKDTMDFLAHGVRRHKSRVTGEADVIAASPRVQSFAPVRNPSATAAFEAGTLIVGVDPVGELATTSVGEYVAAAELRGFAAEYHLWPLISILDFSLVFEDPAYAPERGYRSAVHVGPPDEHGNRALIVDYHRGLDGVGGDMLLRIRNYVNDDAKIDWSSVDRIRYREGSPGEDIRGIVRRAVRRISGAADGPALREALSDALERLESLARQRIAAAGKSEKELLSAGNLQGGPYPGDAAAMIFLRDVYLDGMGGVRAELTSRLKRGLVGRLRGLANATETPAPDHLFGLIAALDARVNEFVHGPLAGATTIGDASLAMKACVNDLRKLVEPYLAEHGAQLRAGFNRAAGLLDNLWDPYLLEIGDPLPRSRPLSRLVGEWERNWRDVAMRRDAYRKILPLRTRMLDGESAAEYELRARQMLPLPLPGAPDEVPALARAGSSAILRSYVARRLTPAGLLAEDEQRCLARIRDAAELVVAGMPGIETFTGAEQRLALFVSEMSELVSALREAQSAAGRTPSPGFEQAVQPLSQNEYWRLRCERPGVIVGDALAARLRKQAGQEIPVMVVRYSRGREGDLDIGRTSEEKFTVNAIYHSGMFDDNARQMYADFESYAGMLGVSQATYLLGVRLADYRPYEGRVQELIEEMESTLRDAAREQIEAFNSAVAEAEKAGMAPPARSPMAEAARRAYTPISNVNVSVWEKEQEKLLSAVEREKIILSLLLTLLVVLSGVVILIVVYLTVVEKTKDIGVLKALGASPWGIRSVFMFNALFIGLFGSLLGASIGVAISENLNGIEDWIDQTFGLRLFPPDVYFLTYVPSLKGMDLLQLAAGVAAPTTLWAFFCGILPASQAARRNAVESLHYE